MKRLASGWWVKAMCSISELFLELKIHDTTPFLVLLVGNDRYLLLQRPLLDGLDGPLEDLHSLPLGWIPDLSLFSLAAEITVNPHQFSNNKQTPPAGGRKNTHTHSRSCHGSIFHTASSETNPSNFPETCIALSPLLHSG